MSKFKPSVYCAGKMSGLSYAQANEWRVELATLILNDFIILSPMRDQNREGFEKACAGACDSRFEMVRDLTDLERADVIVARFALNEQSSFGTAVELGTCIPLRKPVIFVIDENDRLLGHPFVQAFPRGIITHNLEDCASYLYSMFNL